MNANSYGFIAKANLLFGGFIKRHESMLKQVGLLTSEIKDTETLLTETLLNQNMSLGADLLTEHATQIGALYAHGYNLIIFVPGEDYLHVYLHKLDSLALASRPTSVDPADAVTDDWHVLSHRVVIVEKTADWDYSRKQLEVDDPRLWQRYTTHIGASSIHNVYELAGESWIPHIQEPSKI